MSHGSSVSIVTVLLAEQPGFEGRFIITVSRLALGATQHTIQWVPGVQWPGCEADNSTPCSAEVMNVWNHTFTAPMCLHGEVLN
jgi:hypothetical protein